MSLGCRHILESLHNPQISDIEYTARILHVAGRELLRLRLTEPEAATHERLLAHVQRLTPALLRQAPRG